MATSDLTFTPSGEVWRGEYQSTGTTVVQVAREDGGRLRVYAGVEGMEAVQIADLGNYAPVTVLLEVDVPSGMTVVLESETAVTSAKMLTEEAAG